MMRAAVLTSLLCSTLTLGAAGDVVSLNDGERVEGIVTERGDEVDVRLDFGTITFAKSEIKSIERSASPLTVLESRAAKLSERDVEGRYRLALEAEKAGFDAFGRALHRQVIALSSDHKGARAALGYRKHDNAWLTEDDYMTQQGYVRMGSGWVTREAAANIERLEAERLSLLEDARRRDADEQRIRALEAEVAAVRRETAEQGAQGGEPLWVPYWNGSAYQRRAVGARLGYGISISGSGGGLRGQIQLGSGRPRVPGVVAAPVVPAVPAAPQAKASQKMR